MISYSEAFYLRHTSPEVLVELYSRYCRQAFVADGAVPVVIAARNEADDLPATLVALAGSDAAVRPVVVENGSTDHTASIASKMGAVLIKSDALHKMGALQDGTAFSLDAFPKTDVLYTDADTLVGPKWASSYLLRLCSGLECPDVSIGVTGRAVIAHGPNFTVDAARTMNVFLKDTVRHFRKLQPIAQGNNMGLHFDVQGALFNSYMRIRPDLFIGEDRAILDMVKKTGGQVLDLYGAKSTVLTRGDRLSSLRDCLARFKGGATREDLYAEYGSFTVYDGSNATSN